MLPPQTQWLDQDAGPVVRPYALIGGRTRPAGAAIDLLALICAVRGAAPGLPLLEPEQATILQNCRVPRPVADLAADLDLPLGVIRILISDLRERGLVTVHGSTPARLANRQVLEDVAAALRRSGR